MKKVITIIKLFLVCSAYTQTGFITLDTNIRWYVTSNISNRPDHYTVFYFYLNTDTVINELVYFKVILSDLDDNGRYLGALRYDSLYNIKMVPPHEYHEHLLYPCSLVVGDTVDVISIHHHEADSDIYQKLVVESLGTIRYDNFYYTIYELRRKCKTNKGQQKWIQGIGSVYGLLSSDIRVYCDFDDVVLRVSGDKPNRLVATSIGNKLIYYDLSFSRQKELIIKHLKETK